MLTQDHHYLTQDDAFEVAKRLWNDEKAFTAISTCFPEIEADALSTAVKISDNEIIAHDWIVLVRLAFKSHRRFLHPSSLLVPAAQNGAVKILQFALLGRYPWENKLAAETLLTNAHFDIFFQLFDLQNFSSMTFWTFIKIARKQSKSRLSREKITKRFLLAYFNDKHPFSRIDRYVLLKNISPSSDAVSLLDSLFDGVQKQDILTILSFAIIQEDGEIFMRTRRNALKYIFETHVDVIRTAGITEDELQLIRAAFGRLYSARIFENNNIKSLAKAISVDSIDIVPPVIKAAMYIHDTWIMETVNGIDYLPLLNDAFENNDVETFVFIVETVFDDIVDVYDIFPQWDEQILSRSIAMREYICLRESYFAILPYIRESLLRDMSSDPKSLGICWQDLFTRFPRIQKYIEI